MTIQSFFKFVELQTKVASVIPFLLGSLYAYYRFGHFDSINFILMLFSLLSFDMMTTALNNYVDYKKAIKKQGFNYEEHNAIVKYNLKPLTVCFTIAFLFLLASSLGFYLYLRTNNVVLLIGVFSFIVGILYSYGPIPISRLPLGEMISGGLMGFVIPLLAIYIHKLDFIQITFTKDLLSLQMNWYQVFSIGIITLPLIFGIANIMLANNLSDMKDDLINNRYTLPVFIGKEAGLKVFVALYYLSYISIIIGVVLRIDSPFSLLTLLTFPMVQKNIQKFIRIQTKKDTFVCSVQNFIIINITHILCLVLGILLF